MPADLGEGDLIAFKFSGDEEVRLITDRQAVRDYWTTRRREPERGTGSRPWRRRMTPPAVVAAGVPCIITGVVCQPVRLHPKIKGIPPLGDTKGGVQLTSVNQKSFESYGLEDIGCAPVSQRAADAYEKALNSLLANELRHSKLSHDAVVVFWSKGDGALVDLFSDAVNEGNPDSIRALYGSAWKGSQIRLDDDDLSPFYALTLSGAIGRGTVRGWHETTLGAVLKNLRHYFDDLDIVRPPQDEGRAPPPARPLAAVGRPGRPGKHRPEPRLGPVRRHPGRAPLPASRPRLAPSGESVPSGPSTPTAPSLLKAYLCRCPPGRRPVHPRGATHARRSLSRSRLPAGPPVRRPGEDPGGRHRRDATIRDRYYGAASATPVVVFPQLMRKAAAPPGEARRGHLLREAHPADLRRPATADAVPSRPDPGGTGPVRRRLLPPAASAVHQAREDDRRPSHPRLNPHPQEIRP